MPAFSEREIKARFYKDLGKIYDSLENFMTTTSEKYIQDVFSPVKRILAQNGQPSNSKKLGICLARFEKKLIQASKEFEAETRNDLINESFGIWSDVARLENTLGSSTDLENFVKKQIRFSTSSGKIELRLVPQKNRRQITKSQL
jgi:hypothetical protein